MEQLSRRRFVTSGLGVGALASAASTGTSGLAQDARRPKVIASANGLGAVTLAMKLLGEGSDILDACIAGVNLVEDDPKDHSVGLGGLPNEEGVVELDSSVMHGPTANGGAVAAIRNIRNPSKVAKLVMERADHVLLVAEGALRFAKAHGFEEEELLTDEARELWLRWKENLNDEDDWLPPMKKEVSSRPRLDRPTGTINLSAIDSNGDLAGVTTTSGLAYKIPGRVGDSPILGAGLFVDNEVGSAGSTGRGEANLLTCASFLVVESMREGKSPEDSCLLACQRIVDRTKEPRLLHPDGQPRFDVKFYALDKNGRHGAAAIYQGAKYALHDGLTASHHDCAYLFGKRQ